MSTFSPVEDDDKKIEVLEQIPPAKDDDKKVETPEQTPASEAVIQNSVITTEDEVITTDDEDPGRGVASAPDPKRKSR